MLDLSLFPKSEEWGTGDEALDNKLSGALKLAIFDLSDKSISDFYFFGIGLKPRTPNPSFLVTIELVTKALFYLLEPQALIDVSIKKMKGNYFSKNKIRYNFPDIDKIWDELKRNKKYRFKNQIDFSVNLQDTFERNPFIRDELLRSKLDLNLKIIFKDFKAFLNEDPEAEIYEEPFFQALKGGASILSIENFAEIWFDRDQIFAIAKNYQ